MNLKSDYVRMKLDLYSFIASIHASLNSKEVDAQFSDTIKDYNVISVIYLNIRRIPDKGIKLFNTVFNPKASPDELSRIVTGIADMVQNPNIPPDVFAKLNEIFLIYNNVKSYSSILIPKSNTDKNQLISTGLDLDDIIYNMDNIQFCFRYNFNNLSRANKSILTQLYQIYTSSDDPLVKSSIFFIAFLLQLSFCLTYR
jgi:hypothetical protein